MAEFLDEEQTIMEERQKENRPILTVSTFGEPLAELRMPKVVCLNQNATLEECVQTMQAKKIGSVVLVNTQDEIVGIFTERDLLMKVVGKVPDLKKHKVKEYMTFDPMTLMPHDSIATVMHNMDIGGFRHVPIINQDGQVISLVSVKDILSFIIDRLPAEIINVPGIPYRGPALRDGG
jgi:CBS domain-containing protein